MLARTGIFGAVSVLGDVEFEIGVSGYYLKGSMRTTAVGRAGFKVSIQS